MIVFFKIEVFHEVIKHHWSIDTDIKVSESIEYLSIILEWFDFDIFFQCDSLLLLFDPLLPYQSMSVFIY